MSAPVVQGWCPGALRPMPAGDGLLLRIRPRGSRLDAGQVAVLAEISGIFGNGQVDLGSRAHRHQKDHDLAVMAAELLAVVHARRDGAPRDIDVAADELDQFTRDGGWRTRPVPLTQRPPAATQSGYPGGAR